MLTAVDRYVEDALRIKSVVGEEDKKVVELLVCDAVEAQLEPLPTGKPIGGPIMLTAESGRGKNYLADCGVCGLPEEWYLSFEAASATAFYYAAEIDPAFLKHRFIYPNEAEAVDTVVEFLRPMFSQATAKKFVTNKNSDGTHVFQELRVEGPITGVVPTTRNTLNRELQTRMLVCELANYENRIKEHTAALSRQFSPDFVADPHGHMVPKWRAALASLTGVRKVVIPFGDHKEFRLSNEDISHGARLWGNLLGLMCAHAWLEQRNREIREVQNGAPAVVATAADYRRAYELLRAVASRSVVNLGETHRKIVQAVYDLKQEDTGPFSSDGYGVRAIAEKAGISPGTVSKNRTFLTKSAGLLYETENGKLHISADADPSWWDGGDVMKGFPRPSEVDGYILSPEGGNSGNTETPDEKPDTYAEKGVSKGGNVAETVETVFPDSPLSSYLNPGESATVEQLERIDKFVREGMSEAAAKAEVLGAAPDGGTVVYAGKGGPGYDVYIGDSVTRGGHDLPRSPWYNPFKVDKPGVKRDGTREEVNDKYTRHLFEPVENYKGKPFDGRHLTERLFETEGKELDGKVLGCWCAGKDGAPEVLTADGPPGFACHCHGQVLLRALRGIKQQAAEKAAESPTGHDVIQGEQQVFEMARESVRSEPLLDDEEEL
jgi:hypothetical protein